MSDKKPFSFEYGTETLVVKPQGQLSSLADNLHQEELSAFVTTIQGAGFKNVLIDFSDTRAIGSSLLGALAKIASVVKQSDGQMAVCNVDENDMQVLEVFHMDQLWQVFEDRETAFAAIGN